MSKQYLTAKIKLTPTAEQEQLLWQVADEARRLYNLALEQQRLIYSHRKVGLSFYDQKKELKDIRKEYFPNLHSQVAQEAIFDLKEAYTSFFRLIKIDETARPPRFRGKKYFYTLTYPQASYHLEDNAITLHNPTDWLKIDFADGYKDIANIKAFKQVEISCQDNNYYACITCEVIPERQITTGKVIAFDPGIKTVLTGYDGEQIIKVSSDALKKTTKHFDKSLDKIKSKLDRSKNGSKRHSRLMKAKKRTQKKRNRRVQQINHTISKELANLNYDTYFIGDWSKKSTLANTNSKKANKKINRAVQNQMTVAKLIDYLNYKSALKSNQVLKVNEARSTKTCNSCNHINPKLNPNICTFNCEKCGYSIGRDENAAINLYKWYAAPVTGLVSNQMSIKFVFGRYNKCLIQTSA